MSELFIWAHRGASATAPENTMAAFRAAEAAGADGIELDVHLSRDGVPVVIHDTSLERTTSGRGLVRHRGLAVLRELDAGRWFGAAFAGEPLPALEEVLHWAGSRLRLNLELKSAVAGRAVLELLCGYPRARVLVSSFDRRVLAELRQAAPELPLGVLCESRFWRRTLRRAVGLRAESFHPRRDRVSRPLIAACHAAGLAVYPWTVDDGREARGLRRAGVDGVFTNDPGGLRRLLGAAAAGGSL